MRLIPFPRRHRLWWLLAAVATVAAWGSWPASTGRTPDYGDVVESVVARLRSSNVGAVPFLTSTRVCVDPIEGQLDDVQPIETGPYRAAVSLQSTN